MANPDVLSHQKCRNAALDLLSRRLHSVEELRRKLARKQFAPADIDAVLNGLISRGFLNDEKFAAAKSFSAMQHKQHGRRRAYMELLKCGVKGAVADQALNEVYSGGDSLEIARKLARRKATALRRLDPMTARRRLAGMLQRRGFDYEAIKTVIDEALNQGN